MIKKNFLWTFTVLLTISMLLSACSNLTVSGIGENVKTLVDAVSGGEATNSNTGTNTFRETQLALGTFSLEDSDYPINSEQAKQLLPLWKAVRSLSESEIVADQELEAVFKQIQNTMTAEQLQIIESLELTSENLASIASEAGLDLASFGRQAGSSNPEMQGAATAGEGSEAPPSDIGGGQFPGSGGTESLVMQVNQTGTNKTSGNSMDTMDFNPALATALIDYLTARVG